MALLTKLMGPCHTLALSREVHVYQSISLPNLYSHVANRVTATFHMYLVIHLARERHRIPQFSAAYNSIVASAYMAKYNIHIGLHYRSRR